MMTALSPAEREAALAPPSGVTQIVLDTDTKNEIDDQFAIVYALLSERIDCRAIYAAPFVNAAYPTPALGMEASYREIHAVLERMGDRAKVDTVLTGARSFITSSGRPDDNPAVRDLIARCASSPGRVVVVAIGALTNIASALLLEPSIARNMVLLWLGGHPEYWPTAREFNLSGDLKAAQLVFDSGVPLVHFPCKNVAEHIRSVPAEIDRYVRPCGAIGAYLADIFVNHIPGEVRSKVIWDLAPLAWLNNPAWVPTKLMPTPRLTDDQTWDLSDPSRPVYRIATHAHRDPILQHFVGLLRSAYGS